MWQRRIVHVMIGLLLTLMHHQLVMQRQHNIIALVKLQDWHRLLRGASQVVGLTSQTVVTVVAGCTALSMPIYLLH